MNGGHLVFAATSRSLIPTLIKKFTRSRWSHSLVTAPDYIGKEMCIEAAGGGVSMLDFSIGYRNNPDQSYEVYKLVARNTSKYEALSDLVSYLERPYAYLAYPWFIYRIVLACFGVDIKAQDNWYAHQFVCSGLSRAYLVRCLGETLTSEFGAGSMTCEDLYRIVKGRPDLFTLIESKGVS